MPDPIWFHLKHRGQPPRVFVRDEVNNLPLEDATRCSQVFVKVIIPILGDNRYEPNGVFGGRPNPNWRYPSAERLKYIPRYKGFTYTKEQKIKLLQALTAQLGPIDVSHPEFVFTGYVF